MKSWHLDCMRGLAVALARASRAAKPCLCLFYDVSDVGWRTRACTNMAMASRATPLTRCFFEIIADETIPAHPGFPLKNPTPKKIMRLGGLEVG